MAGKTGKKSKPAGETGEDTPADLPVSISIGYQIRETHRALMRLLESRISRAGLSSGMWWFLRALWVEDGISQAELCERLSVMSATTVRAMDRLEKFGLIERRPSPTDRRKIMIHLTDHGRAMKANMMPEALAVQEIASSTLSKAEHAQLLHLLQKVLTNVLQEEKSGSTADQGTANGR